MSVTESEISAEGASTYLTHCCCRFSEEKKNTLGHAIMVMNVGAMQPDIKMYLLLLPNVDSFPITVCPEGFLLMLRRVTTTEHVLLIVSKDLLQNVSKISEFLQLFVISSQTTDFPFSFISK